MVSAIAGLRRACSRYISLLAEALSPYQKVGLPMGEQASLRMPLNDFQALEHRIGLQFCDCSDLIKSIRMIKSDAEIRILKKICTIASQAFSQADELFRAGMPLNQAFRDFKIALLESGAEEVPYLVGGAGQGGYDDVISPPDSTPLNKGDVLMLDTGSTLQGYFCDFDRNYAIGEASNTASNAYETLWQATQCGLDAARAGYSCAELFHTMHNVIGGDSNVGRYGHGLGIQLTEYPSIAPFDHTVLQAGMVITLEPSIAMPDGKMMVHEENILITNEAPILLSQRAPEQLPVIV